jgi:thymidylate synthase
MADFTNIFQELIQNIDTHGDLSKPRDLEVKELLLANVRIDPTKPIANFEARSFNWKYFAGEMAWYLHRDTNIDYINKFSGFWKGITNPGTNEINSNYGALVINDDQIGWVVDSLLADKNSRQAIMFFNQPKFQFEGNKDFVCTMYANFFIRSNRLHMKVQMRSNDVFYGLTFDAPFFSFLMQSVYLILKKNEKYSDLTLGTYHHFADNIHYYERHFELADKIKNIDPITLQDNGSDTLILKKPLFDYINGAVSLTDDGVEFITRIDETEGAKGIDYKNILSDYFTI